MDLINEFRSEIDALCYNLNQETQNPDSPSVAALCDQLWSIVYRSYSSEEKRRLCTALQEELKEVSLCSRTLAQSLEFLLELNWARRLLDREPSLSVNFLNISGMNADSTIASFVSLLHGYPLAWALPRYKAELELLHRLKPEGKVRHVIVIGSSAIPFTGFYFSNLDNIRVTYLDPYSESFALGQAFIEKLTRLGLLESDMVQNIAIDSNNDFKEVLSTLGSIDAAFIVDQQHAYTEWFNKLEDSDVPLVFSQDAVGLARIIYQPLERHAIPKCFEIVGETVPPHSDPSETNKICSVAIDSSDVFLTTVAFARNRR